MHHLATVHKCDQPTNPPTNGQATTSRSSLIQYAPITVVSEAQYTNSNVTKCNCYMSIVVVPFPHFKHPETVF